MKNNSQNIVSFCVRGVSTKKLSEIAVCLYPLSEVNISVAKTFKDGTQRRNLGYVGN